MVIIPLSRAPQKRTRPLLPVPKPAGTDPILDDLSSVADYLRQLTPDGTVPDAESFFAVGPHSGVVVDIGAVHCWECGNSLEFDEATPVEVGFGGEQLRVPMCSVCAPSVEGKAA